MNGVLSKQKKEMRALFLTPSEVREALHESPILYFPIGSIEWHNEHLPLGTDSFHAEILAAELCEAIGGVVLPTFCWNTGACHRTDVTYFMSEIDYTEIFKKIVLGLSAFPIDLLVLINGHGGKYQVDAMKDVAEFINQDDDIPFKVIVADPYYLATDCECRIDHADTGETSFAMSVIPEFVNLDANIQPDIYSERLPFIRKGPPSKAFGDKLHTQFLQEATALIKESIQQLDTTFSKSKKGDQP